jgi:hypothetical protein
MRVLMNDDPNSANVKLSSYRLRPSQSAYIDGPRPVRLSLQLTTQDEARLFISLAVLSI